jgi:hypothetical protein
MTVAAPDRSPPVTTLRTLNASVALDDSETFQGEAMGKDELTPTEVARELRVSPSTVRRWEETDVLKPSRRLPHSGHRRYSRSAVDALKRKLAAAGQYDPEKPASDGS